MPVAIESTLFWSVGHLEEQEQSRKARVRALILHMQRNMLASVQVWAAGWFITSVKQLIYQHTKTR